MAKNKKGRLSKKKAVENTAKLNKNNRTTTIEVSVRTGTNTMPKNKNYGKKKINKQKREKKKKNNHITKILKIMGITFLIVGAIVFLVTSPLFNVTKIEVLGNENVSKEEIISLSQIRLQENMFKYLKGTITQNIKGNSYIEDVKVKRVLPNTMQITVQERQVKFMIKLLESYAYINSQGYILEVSNQTKEVPIIEGASTPEEEMIAGRRLNNEDLSDLEVALSIISAFEENEISRFITSINIKNSNEYMVYMAEKSKMVHLGNNTNLGTKILYVKAILEAEEGNEGDIFVNGDLINGFQPFFRKKV